MLNRSKFSVCFVRQNGHYLLTLYLEYPTMKIYPHYFLLSVSLLLFFSHANGQGFSPTSVIDVIGFNSSNLSIGDYDKDGHQELLISGYRWNTPTLSMYNIVEGAVEKRMVPGLPEHADRAEWVDFDADGDLDVFVVIRGQRRVSASFYVNNNGIFSQLEIALLDFSNANITLADYDGDTDVDVLVSGSNFFSNVHGTCIFKNDKNNFIKVTTNLKATYQSSIVWGDFDNDKDLDVIICWDELWGGTVTYNQNNGKGDFTQVSKSVPLGELQVGDFDNDNDLDLLSSEPFSLMINDGAAEFSPIPGFILTGSGQNKWADYDMDGDLDLFHYEWSSDLGGILKLYEYDGSTYTQIQNTGLPGTPEIGFYDYDHDSDLDLMALNEYFAARIYRNNKNSNPYALDRRPSPVADFTVQPVDNSTVRIKWLQLNKAGVTGVKIEMSTENGSFSEVATGGANSYSEEITGLTQGTLYSFRLRVQNAYGYSQYSSVAECRTVTADMEKTAPFPTLSTYSAALSDLDSDGDIDVIYSGYDGYNERTYILSNNNGQFDLQSHNLPIISFYDIDAADFDHDGDMDLLMSGTPEDALLARTIIAVNNGNFNFTIHPQQLTGVRSGFSRWVEINGDGYPDIYLSGTVDGQNLEHDNQVLINQKDGSFIEVTDHGLPTVYQSDVEAADFNNDGKVDIAVTGFKDTLTYSSVTVAELYINQGDNKFQLVQNLGSTADTNIESADFDNDGDLDMVCIIFGKPARIYQNNGGVFREDTRNNLFTCNQGELAVGDLDNDGDTDIIFGGKSDLVSKSVVYLNDGTGLFTEGYYPLDGYSDAYTHYALGDIDNDGDLDIFDSGELNILINNITTPNTAPHAPVIAKQQSMPGGFYLLMNAGDDDHSKKLSYNLYVKNSDGEYLYNLHSDNITGKLKRAINGNMALNDSISIQSLDPGSYEVGVQNIDNAFNASPFTTTSIEVELVAPKLLKNLGVCESSPADIEVMGNQVRWFTDASLTDSVGSGNRFHPITGAHDTTFYASQQYQQLFSPPLKVQVRVDPFITGEISQVGDALFAPEASTYIWCRNDTLLNGIESREIKATIPGVYRVKATRGFCTADSIIFTLKPALPNASSPNATCLGNTITIEAEGEKIQWYDSDSTVVDSGNSYLHTITSLNDTIVWASQTINTIEGAKAPVVWNVYPYPDTTLVSQNATLIAPDAEYYEWYKDDVLLQNETNKELKITSMGIFYCRASNWQCSVETQSITVIFTPLELHENRQFYYSISDQQLRINLPEHHAEQVSIFNVSGKNVLTENSLMPEGREYVVDISALRPGLYIFVVEGSELYRGKFVKLD